MKKILRFLPPVISVIFLALVLFISLRHALGLSSPNLKNSKAVVYIHDDSLIFEDLLTGQVYLRVSPYDDYFYTQSEKSHLAVRGSAEAARSTSEYASLLQNIIRNPTVLSLRARYEETQPSVAYTVSEGGKGEFVLSRAITDPKGTLDAIGQSFVLCYGCIVTDDQKYVYFNYELLAENKEKYARSLGLVVFSIHRNQALPGVGIQRDLIIRDGAGKRLFSIHLLSTDTAYFDEKYHLLEIKRVVKSNQTTSTVLTF